MPAFVAICGLGPSDFEKPLKDPTRPADRTIVALFHRRLTEAGADEPNDRISTIPSAVRLLRDDAELREALERADARARLVAGRSSRESNRYTRLIEELRARDAGVQLRVVNHPDMRTGSEAGQEPATSG